MLDHAHEASKDLFKPLNIHKLLYMLPIKVRTVASARRSWRLYPLYAHLPLLITSLPILRFMAFAVISCLPIVNEYSPLYYILSGHRLG